MPRDGSGSILSLIHILIMGERYKMVPKESKKIMLGEFGQTVKPFNPEVQKKIIGDETPITCRPADLIEPQLPQFEKDCAQWKQQDEDVLSYALFPQVAKDFFIYREAQQTKVDQTVADKNSKAYPVLSLIHIQMCIRDSAQTERARAGLRDDGG